MTDSKDSVIRMELPKWYDLHAHFRQGDIMPHLIRDHLAMGCAGILAMPNTAPPVAKISKSDDLPYWSIEEYLDMLRAAGGEAFDEIIVPLYLTKDTTPEMIGRGVKAGILKACKYYPPHGTTGAEFGAPMETYIKNGVLKAMEEAGVILCVHGEAHDMRPEEYVSRETNAEHKFYNTQMRKAVDKFPRLKVVCEHVTTKTAVEFVKEAPETVAATVTPQHLLYTLGHLLKGLNYHLYCLPLLKFEEDRAALREAVTDPENTKFFAGTDSAPHVEKVTECGCAAGCYTGGIAPQLYAQAFEESGVDFSLSSRTGASPEGSHDNQEDSSHALGMTGLKTFENFLCRNGPNFYDLKTSKNVFMLEKKEGEILSMAMPDGQNIKRLTASSDSTRISWCIV